MSILMAFTCMPRYLFWKTILHCKDSPLVWRQKDLVAQTLWIEAIFPLRNLICVLIKLPTCPTIMAQLRYSAYVQLETALTTEKVSQRVAHLLRIQLTWDVCYYLEYLTLASALRSVLYLHARRIAEALQQEKKKQFIWQDSLLASTCQIYDFMLVLLPPFSMLN